MERQGTVIRFKILIMAQSLPGPGALLPSGRACLASIVL